ncbi:S28 family serine protease [Archangium violaceum]|uniref:S28 family serine protease n=1 Tax=Archangium violaceum TaxID=83451 RepID=UPI0036DD29F1
MRYTGRVTRSPFLLSPLLLMLSLGACGDNPKPTPDAGVSDAGTKQPDASTEQPDSGTEQPDAGTGETDGGTNQCGTGLRFMEAVANKALLQDTSLDILERLRAIPGLTVQENPNGARLPTGYRFFIMQYDQPADHSNPECQRFQQRLTLLHTSDTAPMVLYTGGYYVSTSPSRRELTSMLGANQLSVEHRFFLPSRPEPADWSLLTIKQSADDFHRIVQAFKPLYGGRWLSTGASKGGETVVFNRHFHPDDVDATVAYVAPLAFKDDARFPAFMHAVGGDAQAACRERIHTFQRTVLGRREEMLGLLRTYAQDNGLTFTQLGFERALEHAVIETYFGFWQYNSPASCDNVFPGSEATSAQLLDVMNSMTGLATFADNGSSGLGYYAPYYYQASVELGWPGAYDDFLGDLIHFPDTDVAPVYAPPGLPLVFRESAMQGIQDWVSTRGERLMFIYGELDPWTSAAFSLGSASDSYLYVVPGGNHGSSISRLPETQRSEALGTVRRWAGLPTAGLKSTPPAWVEEPQFEEFAPHLPPRLRQRTAP